MVDKYESRRIRNEIRRVLLDVWDPIGIKDLPNAQDEYDGYIGEIYELLASRAPDAKLSAYLHWVAHERMGFETALASNMADTVQALKKIDIDSEEAAEFEAHVSARHPRLLMRAIWATAIFAATILAVIPFLEGNPLHRYWDSGGRYLLLVAMAELPWFVFRWGIVYSSWQSARETRREFSEPD
jgi:hypothetical protein